MSCSTRDTSPRDLCIMTLSVDNYLKSTGQSVNALQSTVVARVIITQLSYFGLVNPMVGAVVP